MNKESVNNNVFLCGEIAVIPTYSHEVYKEKFYSAQVATIRMSGAIDYVPVLVSERLIDKDALEVGTPVEIVGEFRSYNARSAEGNHLQLHVFCKEIAVAEATYSGVGSDDIYLTGYVCKEPTYRKTPRGREVTDLFLAVNRPYGKSDYIPCICWGRNSLYTSVLPVGTCVSIAGRIQSREYLKKFEDGTQETRTAYEVSINRLDVVEVENESNA